MNRPQSSAPHPLLVSPRKHSARIQLDNHKEEQQAELQKWVELVSNEKKKTLDRQELLEQLAQRERQETFDVSTHIMIMYSST